MEMMGKDESGQLLMNACIALATNGYSISPYKVYDSPKSPAYKTSAEPEILIPLIRKNRPIVGWTRSGSSPCVRGQSGTTSLRFEPAFTAADSRIAGRKLASTSSGCMGVQLVRYDKQLAGCRRMQARHHAL